MSPRSRRALLALAAAGSVLLSGLTLSAPAEAASQSALLSMSSTINENVRFSGAGSATPIKVGRRIELQVRTGSRWNVVDTLRQDEYGVVTFSGKVSRTTKAKAGATYEWRYFRVRARATGGLKEKVSSSKRVKVMLDPKVYYRVVRASVSHTDDGTIQGNGCGIGASLSGTRKTTSKLLRSESGAPKWRATRLGSGSIRAQVDPGLDTTWTQALRGCVYFPTPATCEATRVEKPTPDGRENFGVRVDVPTGGSRGTVLFYTRGLHVGYSSPGDSVCNVPYMEAPGLNVKFRTKAVPRKTLLGKKAFTVVNQGAASWDKDVISGKAADLKLRWTESITLQRVDSRGRTLR